MRKLFLFFLMSLSLGINGQTNIDFNENWKFSLGDFPEAKSVTDIDKDWRTLDLPHDWSIEGEYKKNNPMGGQCGYLPAGIGWYRKTIKVPDGWKDKYIEIAFDGIFMNSTVWANGQKLGHRPYGWISFGYDISNLVSNSDSITFAVRVDNDKQPSARWYTGSGIYANTWIRVKNKIHIPDSGIFVRTNGNKVIVDTEIKNTLSSKQNALLITSVRDAGGKVVSKHKQRVKAGKDEIKKTSQDLIINNPNLWYPASPYLYTLISEIEHNGQVIDKVETRFGVRDIEWKPETGMWLNDKNIKLHGVCNHQDAGALGAAVPDKILRYRLRQLKDMGVNAIRTAHNPQTPQFYDMCDEMGILVMNEIFDGWSQKAEHDYGAHAFDKWWNRDLTDWIKRDRNHPSVVIYSVGNETHGEIGEKLVARCHELDPTRPVTSGHSASEYMDILGVNGHSERKGFIQNLETDRVFVGTENTHTWQVRGFYRTQTWYRDGYPNERQMPYYYPDLTEKEVFSYDWTNAAGRKNFKQVFNSSYDNAMVRLTSRQNIQQLRDISYYAGSFRWTGHDYLGEASYVHGGWPFKAFMGGAIDLANFEKDLYYLYQSQWTDEPMVHILPHWTHPSMEEGTDIPVWVYSNCDEVELFLNGKSLGKERPGNNWDEMQCEWMVGWSPGELKAIGYNDGFVVAEQTIKTADAPGRIALSVDGEPLKERGKDIVQIRVATLDQKGEFYPYGENRNYFHVIGPAKIRALDNGSPIDTEKHFEATNRIAFFGLARAYIESNNETGNIALLASAILGEKKQISSDQVSIDVQLLSLRGSIPEADIEVFYTTDGSLPTVKSMRYTSPFNVSLGTTVKALVLLNGEAVHIMEERFAQDEGFVWDAAAYPEVPGADQAEDAKIEFAGISVEGSNYNGDGYVYFGRNSGGYVEWYQENDGSPGTYKLKVRYSASEWIRDTHKVLLTVNDESQELTLPSNKNFRNVWQVYEVKVPLKIGANTIQLKALEDGGLCVDELRVE
ncbi:glycoside hydrolase family 2 TIM barrel-domain containing protein [Marinilabilia rubra]|uniref:Beta-galactosidase n=1 Tax=Marinilabilia rubra TaxID=2162893 RepID=A0A2U2B7K9_9BACT|nr:glycoside hydrolase family 2 TIM barrel-domain containing protein [Marinilabilia rubra]PWD99047.1 beta-galactosidase [Marinilabilia rubra]